MIKLAAAIDGDTVSSAPTDVDNGNGSVHLNIGLEIAVVVDDVVDVGHQALCRHPLLDDLDGLQPAQRFDGFGEVRHLAIDEGLVGLAAAGNKERLKRQAGGQYHSFSRKPERMERVVH